MQNRRKSIAVVSIILVGVLLFGISTIFMSQELVVNAENTESLLMDTRKSIGVYEDDTYQLSTGVTVSSKTVWKANTSLLDSKGEKKTLYVTNPGSWVQYHPNQSGAVLEFGYYDIYFWFPYHEQNEGINLNAEIYSGGKTYQVPCSTLVQNAGTGNESRWVKIGGFYFTGASDEYLKLTSTGYARVADVKFEKVGMQMNTRVTEGNLSEEEKNNYELGLGVTLSSQTIWNANSLMTDSQGVQRTLFCTQPGASVQYFPNQAGLERGTYDVYFWFVYQEQNAGINLNAEVFSNGGIVQVPCAKLQENAGNGTESRWVKVGTYFFTGNTNEYLKLTSTGYARIADIKFVKTDLHMDVRSTVGQVQQNEHNFDLSAGVTLSSKENWSANSTLTNSQNIQRTIWTSRSGEWVQYTPSNTNSGFEEGIYDVYFWFIHHEQNVGINLNAEVNANGQMYQVPCSDLQTSAGSGSESRWVKIGQYQFNGTNDEYLKLTSTGYARIADVKFVKTASIDHSASPSPAPSVEPIFQLTPDYTFDDGNSEVFTLSVPSEASPGSYSYGTSTTGGSSHTYCDLDSAKGIYTITGVSDGKYEVYYKIPLINSNNTNKMTLSLTDSAGMIFHRTYDIQTDGADQQNPADNVSAQGYHTQQWIKLEGTYSFYSDRTATLIAGKEKGYAGNVRYDTVGLVKVGEAPPLVDYNPTTVQANCVSGQIYDYAVIAQNQQPQSNVKYIVTYNPNELALYDIYGYTPEQELSAEALQERGILLLANTPGHLIFQCTDTAAAGQTLSGAVNLLRFKALSDGERVITVKATREVV